MIRFMLLAAAILMTGACATTQDPHHSIGDTICARKAETQLALNVAMSQTNLIADPVKQEAARGAIRIAYAALEKCP